MKETLGKLSHLLLHQKNKNTQINLSGGKTYINYKIRMKQIEHDMAGSGKIYPCSCIRRINMLK